MMIKNAIENKNPVARLCNKLDKADTPKKTVSNKVHILICIFTRPNCVTINKTAKAINKTPQNILLFSSYNLFSSNLIFSGL